MHRSTHVLGLIGVAAGILLLGILLGMTIEHEWLTCPR